MFLRERETQSAGRGPAEREGDTDAEAGSKLSAQSLRWGSELTNCEIMT